MTERPAQKVVAAEVRRRHAGRRRRTREGATVASVRRVLPHRLFVVQRARLPACVARLRELVVLRVEQAVHDGVGAQTLVFRRHSQTDCQVDDFQEDERRRRRPRDDDDDAQQLDAEQLRIGRLRRTDTRTGEQDVTCIPASSRWNVNFKCAFKLNWPRCAVLT